MENGSATPRAVFLLASHARTMLDGRAEISPWIAGLACLYHVRPARRDDGPHPLGLLLQPRGWHIWLHKLHLHDSVVVAEEHAIQWWLRSWKLVPKQARRGFDSLFFLIGWTLWKERNARTFNGVSSSVPQLAALIHDEIDSWCLAGYRHLRALMAMV
jgi:hypothetical protein